MKRTIPAAVVIALACGGGGDAAKDAPAAGATPALTAGPVSGATITGTVRFSGTVSNPVIDMSEEPACRDKHTGEIRDPVTLTANGNLANVVIYVTSGLPSAQQFTAPAAAPVLDQNGCLYQPRALSVMTNQSFTIRNSDPVLHNIKAVPKTNRGFNISQPSQGMESQRAFPRAEAAIPLQCNVHGWMRASVFVLDHPFHDVSAEDGSFTIAGLPPGTYTLEAWHEQHGTRTATVTVAGQETQAVSFAFGG
jgi:hypothetical protein